jgi:hypothetical protein
MNNDPILDPYQSAQAQKDFPTGRLLDTGEESSADWLIRKQTERDLPFKKAIQAGFDTPQTQAIRLLRTSSTLGVPSDLIKDNLDEAEKQASKDSFDSTEFQKYSPVLAKWLSKDPNYVAVMKPDFQGLTNLQQIFYRKNDPNRPQTQSEMEARAMAVAQVQAERVAEGYTVGGDTGGESVTPEITTPSISGDKAKLSETVDKFYQRNLMELQQENELLKRHEPIGFGEAVGKRLSENPYAPVPLLSEMMDFANYLPYRDAKKAIESNTATIEDYDLVERADRLAAVNAARGTTFGADFAGTALSVAPFALGAAMTGGMATAAEVSVERAAGAAGESFLQRAASFALSKSAGAAIQTPILGIGRIPLDALKRNTPEGDYGRDENGNTFYNVKAGTGEDFWLAIPKATFGLFSDLVSAHAFGWWKGSGLGPATKEGLSTYLAKNGLKSALEGMGMSEVSQLLKETAGVQPWDMPSTLKMLSDPKAAQEGMASSAFFAMLGIAGAGPREGISSKLRAELIDYKAKAIKSLEDVQAHDAALAKAGETIKGMSSTTAAPEINKQAIEKIVESEPFQYVDAHKFEEVYNQQGLDPHAEAAKLTGKPDALKDALDRGLELQIPTADYLQKISATDQAALFQGEARPNPLWATTKEAQDHLAEIDSQMEAERKAKADAQGAKQPKPVEDPTQIGEKIAAQAEAAGRTKPEASAIGKIVESVYRVLGMRSETPAQDLANKYGPIIQKAKEEAGLQQPGGDVGPRGSYIPRDITGDKAIINAFASGDRSTVVHELGHQFLDMLADLSSKDTISLEAGHNESLKADFQKFLDWRGINSPESWSKMSLDQKRSHHEAWADAYEQWLFEGKAPSKGLAGVFHRFREWIGAVYDKFVGKGIVIPEEIRGVFERLHSTDAELQSAKERIGRLEPFLENAPNIVFSPKEQEAIAALQDEANRHAIEKVDAESLSDIHQQESAQYAKAKEIIRQEVTKEFQQTKEAKALAYFKDWKTPEGENLPEGTPLFKLSSEDVANENPGLDLKSLPKGVLDADFNEDNGISPKAAADVFGFTSGEELVKALINTDPTKSIETETTARAAQNLIEPGMPLDEAARRAIHSDQEQKLSIYQMKWLVENKLPQMQKILDRLSDPDKYIGDLKAYASTKMLDVTYRNRDVRVYERGEKDARKAAREAVLKGDFTGAIAFKEREVLNHELARAAYEAKDQADKVRKYLSRFSDRDLRARIGKADNVTGQEALAVIDNINRRFEFTNDTAFSREGRGILVDYIAERLKDGNDGGEGSVAPSWLLNEAFKVNWKDLKHGDLLALRDTAKQIETQARAANLLRKQEKAMTMADARVQIKERLSGIESRPPESSRSAKNIVEKTKEVLRNADAAMVKMEQVIREADGGDINGPFHRLFFFGAADAQAKELDYKKSVQAEIAKATAELPKAIKAKMNDIIALPGRRKITRFDTLGFAHQSGNASNWRKFLAGEAMRKGGFTEGEISKFISDLSKPEKDLVQKLWDLPEPVFAEASKMYKRLTGLEPDKIEAAPQHPAFDGYRGGYAHIVYDSRESKQGERQANAEIGEFTKSGYMRSTTSNGYSKGRAEGFAAPMDTDISNFSSHMGVMIHDLAYREWALDFNKLIGDREISETIKDKLGNETFKRMKEWQSVIVNDRNQNSLGSLGVFKRLINAARLNMAIVVTGFKAGTLLHHLTSIEGAIGEIGPKYMAMGAQKFFAAPFEAHKDISNRSGEMRHFAETFDRDIMELYRQTQGKTDYIAQSQRAASHAIGIANLMRAEPIWYGAYFKAMDTLATEHTGDAREKLAVRSADEVVRLTVGAGAAKDRAAIMSPGSDFMKVFTTFFTPGSVLYSRLHDIAHDTKRGDVSQAVTKVFWTAIIASLSQKVITGHGPDTEHGETWAGWIARNEAMYPLSSVPILKDAADAVMTGRVSSSANPIVRASEQMLNARSAISKAVSGDMSAGQAAETTARAANMFLGMPIDQLFITGDYVRDLSTGDKAKPDDLFEWWQNVLHYHRKAKR